MGQDCDILPAITLTDRQNKRSMDWKQGTGEDDVYGTGEQEKTASPDDGRKQREREFEKGIMNAGNRAMKGLLEELKSQRK